MAAVFHSWGSARAPTQSEAANQILLFEPTLTYFTSSQNRAVRSKNSRTPTPWRKKKETFRKQIWCKLETGKSALASPSSTSGCRVFKPFRRKPDNTFSADWRAQVTAAHLAAARKRLCSCQRHRSRNEVGCSCESVWEGIRGETCINSLAPIFPVIASDITDCGEKKLKTLGLWFAPPVNMWTHFFSSLQCSTRQIHTDIGQWLIH